MDSKKLVVKLSMFLLLITVLTVGITFAYFQIKVSGIESVSTVSVGGSQLEIKYVGTNQVVADRIIPSWSDTKYFSVEIKNTTGKVVKYDINIEVVDSNFYTEASPDKGYMQYKLKKCTTSSNDTCTEVLVDASIIDVQTGTKKVTAISTTETSGTTYYALDFIYPDTGAAQSQSGTDGELVHFSGYVTLVSSTNTKPIPVPVSFASDSWATIAANVQANKEATASVYSVGSEKEVSIDGINVTVRIANNSNYDCTLDSKTACGFVVEFVDIITSYNMNPAGTYNGTYYEYGTNLGGWPSSAMYKYINGDTENHLTYGGTNATLYSKLPSELRNVIADTTVISGHGLADKNTARTDENWESTDKLYLLSAGEIYGNCLTENCYDTASYPYNNSAATTTRQLDYYNGVTMSANYERAIKQQGGSNTWWWLRAANPSYTVHFRYVYSDGNYYNTSANSSGGVAPAFRIA